MRETVLLFNIKDKKRAQELQMICMSLRIRVRLIKKEEYFQTVGVWGCFPISEQNAR